MSGLDGVLLTKLVASLVLPPGVVLLLAALGAVAWRAARRLAMIALLLAFAALYLLSTAGVSQRLAATLERAAVLSPGDPRLQGLQAIVVLGGGRRLNAPEYGGATVSGLTLERIRFGARLHRASGLPLAVSGGSVWDPGVAEAQLMAEALQQDYGIGVRWVEDRSRNTEQNALQSHAMLAADDISRIALVSHAMHLPRAVEMFRWAGFEQVVPAPTGFKGNPRSGRSPLDWVPSAGALLDSWMALHEHLGRVWFRLRHRSAKG